jgi:hypothetical protein
MFVRVKPLPKISWSPKPLKPQCYSYGSIWSETFLVKPHNFGTYDICNNGLYAFEHYDKMKNELLAPNGKPSNLTPEQWKLVRTPQFKAWFGDWENDPENASKVVDENGEPLVCFHYSPKEFSIFDKKHHPKIANFVENKYHKHLGYDFSTKKGFFQTKDSFEYKVFLNVKNIFNIS